MCGNIIDLTRPFEKFVVKEKQVYLKSQKTEYTGLVYDLGWGSMESTYIDFPGHIFETGNGLDASTVNPADFYRMKGRTVRLHRQNNSGAVTAEDLEKAAGSSPIGNPEVLVINALGPIDCKDIVFRSVYLSSDAVQWIIDSRCRLLISDAFESQEIQGVFLRLFDKGICTICNAVNLHLLTEECLITTMFNPVPGVQQLPCRVLAEI